MSIQQRRLLLNPNGNPVPSVLVLSSNKVMVEPTVTIAVAVAVTIIDLIILIFESSVNPFFSKVHLTRSFVVIIDLHTITDNKNYYTH